MIGTRTALFVSLAVNVLLLGAIVGGGLAGLRQQHARDTQTVARAPNMRVLMQSLPPTRAAEVREHVVGAWRDAQAERRAARQARLEIARVAGAEPYDVAAAKTAFANMRAADARVAAKFHDVVAEAMASMTVAERRAMLRELATRRMEQGRRGQRGRALPESPSPPGAQEPSSP